jgi:hypothetical protein
MYYKRSRFDRNLSRVKDNLPMVLVVMIALAFFYFVCSYYGLEQLQRVPGA